MKIKNIAYFIGDRAQARTGQLLTSCHAASLLGTFPITELSPFNILIFRTSI